MEKNPQDPTCSDACQTLRWHVLYRWFSDAKRKAFHLHYHQDNERALLLSELTRYSNELEYLKVLEGSWACRLSLGSLFDDFNFWKFWLCPGNCCCMVHLWLGPVGALSESWCVGFSFNTFLIHNLEVDVFLQCLLSSFFLSTLSCFFLSIFCRAYRQAWLMQCNISSAFKIYRYTAFCLEHPQSLQLDSLSLSSFTSYLRSYWISVTGSCGIKSSYAWKPYTFRGGCFRRKLVTAVFSRPVLLRILLKFDFNFYNYSLWILLSW